MAEPSDTHPAAFVTSDSRREAIHTIAGYDWQRWLTVAAWLSLEGEECLWIEWAEDFTVTHPTEGSVTVQAKHRAGAITLGQAEVQRVISAAWERPASVRTLVWTSAAAGFERGAPFAEPGIIKWAAIADSRQPSDGLRQFLLDAKALGDGVKRKIASADDAQFRQMLRQVQWAVGETDSAGLRDKVHALAESRMKAMAIRNASLSREAIGALLFEAVANRSIEADVTGRRLTRVGLDQKLARWHRERLDGAAPEILAKLGADQLALQRADRNVARAAPPWSFAWFVYTTKTIPFIGRETEKAEIGRFAADPALFLWWAIGGAGGAGKSRLAQEAILELGDRWIPGFARVDELSQLCRDLALQTSDMMIVVDYAAVDAKAVANFLSRCGQLASPTRKIRVLLIDRDPSFRKEWWRSLFEPFSSQAATLQGSLYAEPLYLRPLLNEGRSLLEAWLDAAGEPARPEPATWEKIAALCAGNPLLLGFAAAGLARGDTRFDSIADLLRGLSEREWRKMRAGAASEMAMQVAIDMSMTATFARRPLYEYSDHDVLTLYSGYSPGVNRMSVALIEMSNGMYRLPTFGDIDAMQLPGGLLDDVLAGRRHMRQVVGDLVAPHTLADAFSCAYDLLSPELQIQPDLLGEFILAECLGAAPSQLRPGVVPSIDDARLDRQMRAAWRIAPFQTVFTLEQLRQHPWSASGFIRAANNLAQWVDVDDPSEAVNELARCLSNAAVRVGGAKASITARQQMFDALNTLAGKRPDDAGVLRRRFNALKQLINVLGGTARDGASRIYLTDTLALLPILAGERDVELHIMEVIVGLGQAAKDRLAGDDAILALATLEALLQAYSGVEEVIAKASELYFSISAACASHGVPFGKEEPATLEFARAVLPSLIAGVREFVAACTRDRPENRIAAAMSLVNASQATLKLKQFEGVEPLVHTVLALTGEPQRLAKHRLVALHALKNLALAAMWRDDIDALQTALDLSTNMAYPAMDHDDIAEVLLEIVVNTLGFNLSGAWPAAARLRMILVTVPWPLDRLRVRQLLFASASSLVPGDETVTVELAIAEARARNPNPAVADFLEVAWSRFDPSQVEDGPDGLATYLRRLGGAALGDGVDLPLASAVAAFWFAHRRSPKLANPPIQFTVRPDADGVRICLGDEDREPDRWLFFRIAAAD